MGWVNRLKTDDLERFGSGENGIATGRVCPDHRPDADRVGLGLLQQDRNCDRRERLSGAKPHRLHRPIARFRVRGDKSEPLALVDRRSKGGQKSY